MNAEFRTPNAELRTPIIEHPLQKILAPESVAFFGASKNITTMGTFQLLHLLDGGYTGRVYPVHPTAENILGLKTYKSVSDLPEVPDVVVMVLPTRVVPQILDECGRFGIRRATIVSGGFQEVGEDGAALQEEIVAVAKKHGIWFNGPNCIGVVNPHHKYNITWFPYNGPPGAVGLASQSGSYTCHIFDHTLNLGSGFSKTISVGNEAVLDIVDCLDYFETDPDTKAIALYIEGIRRGRAFIDTARRVGRTKPIVALYVGGTEAGGRSGASHTAVLAGDDAVCEGALRQAGVLRAKTFEDLIDWTWVLSCQPPMPGDNVAILGNSGGPGASMADASERAGLNVPELPEDMRDSIQKRLPHTGSSRNPVDLTFTMDPGTLFFDILPNMLLKSDFLHGLLVYGVFDTSNFIKIAKKTGLLDPGPMKQLARLGQSCAEAFVNIPAKYQKPIVGATFFNRNEDQAIRYFQDHGIPFLPSPERAARAMAALRTRAQYLQRIRSSEFGVRSSEKTEKTGFGKENSNN